MASATLQTRLAALREQAQHAPEIWNPEAGDSLIGQLIGSQKASGVYGENYQILIKGEDGSVTAAWLPELKGKVLLCWCYPKQCHGHYLASLANAI